MQATAQKVWGTVQQDIQSIMSPELYKLWFANIRAKSFDQDCLTLQVENDFCEVWLEKNYLEGVSSNGGKFRAFLLVAVKRFLANEWDRANRQKRGGGVAPLSLDWQDADTRYQINPADNVSPDKLYDRAWAVTLLERVIARLGEESAAEGKSQLFEELKPYLMVGKSAIPYAQAASALAMNESAVRVAVHRLR